MSLHKSFILKAFGLFLVAASLTACGYQPLHGKRKTVHNQTIQSELSKVWVYEIKDREGQMLHNELLNLFNPKSRPKEAKYFLKVKYTESEVGLGFGKDDVATRTNLHVTAQFNLKGASFLNSESDSVVSFNILTSPTGTEFAKRDARKRAIKEVAKDIYSRVAVHLVTKAPKKRPEKPVTIIR